MTAGRAVWYEHACLTLLAPQSRFGDNSLGIRLVCPEIGTAVLKGLTAEAHAHFDHFDRPAISAYGSSHMSSYNGTGSALHCAGYY